MVSELQAGALALCIALGVWAGHARAQLFSSTGPVIAILDGELLLGEATGHLGGWGTIAGPGARAGGVMTARVLE